MRPLYLSTMIFSLSATAAYAEPAWEISSKWLCRADRRVDCDLERNCVNETAQALEIIDFEAKILTPFSAQDPDNIGNFKYMAKSKYTDGGSSYSRGVGEVSLIGETPIDDILSSGTYPYRSVILDPNGATRIYYGACKPQ